MARLEDLARDVAVKVILPDRFVTVVDVKWCSTAVEELVYKDAAGELGQELLYRNRGDSLEIIATSQYRWNWEADGGLLRLVSEAYRIRLAHLFDPMSAVYTSLVEPLPHQITAVYGEMLQRQPLHFEQYGFEEK